MKKKILSVMVTALTLVTLVGCGSVSDVISNSTQENEVEVETTTETTTEGFLDTSMDGGAPAPEVTTEEVSEEVVPVESTFTLMSEDGSTVAFEGTVPEGLTLVSGDGTSHIEFADDANPEVTVYLDAGLDNDVLATHKGYYFYTDEIMTNFVDAITASFDSNDIYTVCGGNMTINGNNQYVMGAYINHLIGFNSTENKYIAWGTCECHNMNNNYLDSKDGWGYAIYNYCVLGSMNSEALSNNPFTITVKVEQYNPDALSENELISMNERFGGYSCERYVNSILESFSN